MAAQAPEQEGRHRRGRGEDGIGGLRRRDCGSVQAEDVRGCAKTDSRWVVTTIRGDAPRVRLVAPADPFRGLVAATHLLANTVVCPSVSNVSTS